MRDTLTIPTERKKRLNAKQMQAIPLLASGLTINATAKVLGVGEKSIDNWKHNPEFLAALHAAENQLYDDSLLLLKQSARRAIETLVRNTSEKTSGYVQVAAASKLLDVSLEVYHHALLSERVRALEDSLQEYNEQ